VLPFAKSLRPCSGPPLRPVYGRKSGQCLCLQYFLGFRYEQRSSFWCWCCDVGHGDSGWHSDWDEFVIVVVVLVVVIVIGVFSSSADREC
jgi:hypothetical protein